MVQLALIAGLEEIIYVSVSIRARRIEVFAWIAFERGSSSRAEAVRVREVVREQLERTPDHLAMTLRVLREPIGYFRYASGPSPKDVDHVVGVLGLAPTGKCERLKYNERAWTTDWDCPASSLAGQRVAIECNVQALVERQLQPGRESVRQSRLQEV